MFPGDAMRRFLVAVPLLFALVACGDATRDLAEPVEPLGDFKIGHIGVVAPNLQKLLVSREATNDEWVEAVTDALDARFRRFEGDKFYHLGVSVEAYSLPPPIIPGKSALALNVTLWDDAAQAKMNEEPEEIQIIRLLESRLTSTKESQMAWLVAEAAKDIERWLREKQESDGWFDGTSAEATPEPATIAPVEDTGLPALEPVFVPPNVIAVTSAAAQTSASP